MINLKVILLDYSKGWSAETKRKNSEDSFNITPQWIDRFIERVILIIISQEKYTEKMHQRVLYTLEVFFVHLLEGHVLIICGFTSV